MNPPQKNKLIALLLSALVLPGMGQIYKRDLRKGIFLISLTSLCFGAIFLAGLILLNYEYAAVFPAPLTREMFDQMLFRILKHPVMLFLLGSMLAVWLYGIIDACRPIDQTNQPEA